MWADADIKTEPVFQAAKKQGLQQRLDFIVGCLYQNTRAFQCGLISSLRYFSFVWTSTVIRRSATIGTAQLSENTIQRITPLRYVNAWTHAGKGLEPTFLAMGPDFKEKTVLEKGGIVSTAPTFTKVLGLALANADGKPFTELLQR